MPNCPSVASSCSYLCNYWKKYANTIKCNGYNNSTGIVMAEGIKMHSSNYDVSDYMSLSIY